MRLKRINRQNLKKVGLVAIFRLRKSQKRQKTKVLLNAVICSFLLLNAFTLFMFCLFLKLYYICR
jgi:hypothetical protein